MSASRTFRQQSRLTKEIQVAIARELARRCEVPETMPQRISDLLRELSDASREPPSRSEPPHRGPT